MKKYHYTYRITNITKVALKIYYYGVRSKCHGNFSTICKLNNLPSNALTNSYQNEGIPIYNNLNKRINTRLINNGDIKYKGWYAKII